MSISQAQKDFFYSLRNGNLPEVQRAMARGARVGVYDDAFRTCLHLAVGKGREMVEHLLENSADPNMPDDNGFTPLMQAIAEKDYDALRAMMRHGGKVDYQEGPDKISLLHAAVFATCRDGDMERMRIVLRLDPPQELRMLWQGTPMTAREVAVRLQGEQGDVVGVLDHPDLPVRSLVKAASAAFRGDLAQRAQDSKARFKLK